MATSILQLFAPLTRAVKSSKNSINIGKIGREGWEKKYHVLVLDDYEVNLKVMKLFLEAFGFNFTLTRTAAKCIEEYKSGQYDAAIIDLMMHGMDGFDVARFIRHYEKHNDIKSIKLIAYSANADTYAAKCKEAGFDELLVKPITMSETYKVLKKCLL